MILPNFLRSSANTAARSRTLRTWRISKYFTDILWNVIAEMQPLLGRESRTDPKEGKRKRKAAHADRENKELHLR